MQEKFDLCCLCNNTVNNPSERNKTPFLNNGPVESEEARGIIPGTSADQISNSLVVLGVS